MILKEIMYSMFNILYIIFQVMHTWVITDVLKCYFEGHHLLLYFFSKLACYIPDAKIIYGDKLSNVHDRFRRRAYSLKAIFFLVRFNTTMNVCHRAPAMMFVSWCWASECPWPDNAFEFVVLHVGRRSRVAVGRQGMDGEGEGSILRDYYVMCI